MLPASSAANRPTRASRPPSARERVTAPSRAASATSQTTSGYAPPGSLYMPSARTKSAHTLPKHEFKPAPRHARSSRSYHSSRAHTSPDRQRLTDCSVVGCLPRREIRLEHCTIARPFSNLVSNRSGSPTESLPPPVERALRCASVSPLLPPRQAPTPTPTLAHACSPLSMPACPCLPMPAHVFPCLPTPAHAAGLLNVCRMCVQWQTTEYIQRDFQATDAAPCTVDPMYSAVLSIKRFRLSFWHRVR